MLSTRMTTLRSSYGRGMGRMSCCNCLHNCCSYETSVSTSVAIGHEVLRVSAYDRDIGQNGHVKYELVETGNICMNKYAVATNFVDVALSDSRFSIDPESGAVTVIRTMDTPQTYILHVRALDGGSPVLTDICTVKINVTQDDDRRPEFDR